MRIRVANRFNNVSQAKHEVVAVVAVVSLREERRNEVNRSHGYTCGYSGTGVASVSASNRIKYVCFVYEKTGKRHSEKWFRLQGVARARSVRVKAPVSWTWHHNNNRRSVCGTEIRHNNGGHCYMQANDIKDDDEDS